MKRGKIYYVYGGFSKKTRPAIIVSNDKANRFSPNIEVVYLTTKPKKDLPTHVRIMATGTESTALCEEIYTILKDNIMSDCVGVCSEEEMQEVNDALEISLGIHETLTDENTVDVEEEVYQTKADTEYDFIISSLDELRSKADVSDEIIRLLREDVAMNRREADVFKNLYENLLSEVMKR